MRVRIDKLFILPALWILPALGQNTLPGNVRHRNLPTPSLLVFPDNNKPAFDQWTAIVGKMGNYSALSQWKIYSTLKDELGQTHYRAEHYFNEIPSELSTLILHEKKGQLLSINGDLVPESFFEGKALLTQEQAREKALQFMPANLYYWQDKNQNSILQQLTGNPDTTYFPTGKKIYCPKEFRLENRHRLAYKFNIYALEPLGGKSIYVDAENGEILASQDLILHTEVTGTAVTAYSGTRTMKTDSTAPGNYRLREINRGKGIETYNMRKGTSYGAAVDFTDADNYWNNVNANKDEAATDAHWGAEMTYDYFNNQHSRNSFDATGAKIVSYVHYGNNYNNAFWNGSYMTYGDGNGSLFTPLTALDVCGHEIAHAVTTYTANLVYSYESGALNESFSDIFGNTIEIWARPTKWSWRIGEDMTPSKNGIRSMANPNLFNHPKFYKGVSWYSGAGDNGGVHYNSGVQNYWYYLIANGGTGTNEKGWPFNIDSLGIIKAGKIAYRNLAVYLTKNSQYSDARTFSILSAADLYGQCSKEVIAVTNAWWVCGVGNKYDSGYVKANFTGDTLACRTGKTINFLNLSDNYKSSQWYFGNGNSSTLTNPTHAYSSYGKFNVKLVVTSCFKNKKDSITKLQYVKIDSTYDICNAVLLPKTGTDSAIRCKGFVYDDGGEDNYGPLKVVTFKLKIPGADSIRFRFRVLDYENGYDSVVLFKNSITWPNKIGRYTGTTLPFGGAWQTIKADALWFRQYSDPLLEGKGFKVEFAGIRKPLSVDAGKDTLICYGDSVVFNPTVSGGYAPDYRYSWKHGDTRAKAVVKPTTKTKYYLTLTDICTGKTANDSITVDVRPPLKASLGKDTVICYGKSVKLTAGGTGGIAAAYQYAWNQGLPNGSSHTVTPTATTTYRVILTDGCTDKPDTAYRTVLVKPALQVSITAGITPVCVGKTVSLSANGSGGDTAGYLYSWNNGLGTGKNKIITLNDTQTVILTLSDACSALPAKDTVMLYTYPALKLSLSNDTAICRGSQVALTALISGGKGSGYTYSWAHGKTTGSISETPTASGIWYKVTGSDNCSPSVKDSVRINWLPTLDLSTYPDTSLCDGQTLSVKLTASGGKATAHSVSWNPGGQTGLNVTLNPIVAGITKYTAVLSDGCTQVNDTTSFNVTRLLPLGGSITATPNAVCQGDSITLNLTQTGGKTNAYSWSVDGTPVTWKKMRTNPGFTRSYSYTLTDGCSAPFNTSANVVVYPKPNAVLTTDINDICAGGRVQFSFVSADAVKAFWIFGPKDSVNALPSAYTRTFKNAGNYFARLRVTTSNGCQKLFDITDSVRVTAYPMASFTPNPALASIEQPFIQFNDNSKGGSQYLWFFGDGSTSSTSGSTSHTYSDTGRYRVQLVVTKPPGCADTTEAWVRIKDVYYLHIPNTFTPDDNNLNDLYAPYARGCVFFNMKIYNRWGAKVFETNQPGKGWNGKTPDGKDAMSGLYPLMIETIDTEGFRHVEKGYLILQR
jgi:Zn-dependent metalloprotease